MKLGNSIITATYLSRPNRFTGVEIYARTCLAKGFQIALGGRVPILL
jgi:hypothetical protein